MESMIYHLVLEPDFRAQREAAQYTPANLSADGFVHCSLEASVVPVANDYYADAPAQLLLLEIDPDKLAAETRYEAAAPIEGGGTAHLENAPVFPHVYGPIDMAAVVGIGVLGRNADGYHWPRDFVSSNRFFAAQ